MPYIPTSSQSSSGARVESPGENLATIKEIKDMSKGSTYDVQMKITFELDNGWERNTMIFAKYEKRANGTVINEGDDKKEKMDKDFNKVIKSLCCLGVQNYDMDESDRANPKLLSSKGIFLSDKGTFVMEDDAPIKSVESLLEMLTKDKMYRIYLIKGKKGYDEIAAFCEERILADPKTTSDRMAANYYKWKVDYVAGDPKPTTRKVSQDDSDLYLP